MTEVFEQIVIPSGNARLQVKFCGKPGLETVILLHGGPGIPDEMTELRDYLAGKMQVVTFDQRGTGQDLSRNCSFTIPDYLNDINHIAGYFNLTQFHLLGHSWGGLYAQLYAHEYPQRMKSLFLCSPVAGTGYQWSMAEREIFEYNRQRSTLPEWIGMGFDSFLGLLGSSKAYRRLFRQIIVNYHKGYNVPPPDPEKLAKISAHAGLKTRQAIKKYPPLGEFGATSYPVMITYGQYDAYGKSKEYVFNRFPEATKAIIPDCGHTPWKHNWPAFKEILKDFYKF